MEAKFESSEKRTTITKSQIAQPRLSEDFEDSNDSNQNYMYDQESEP